MKNLFFAFLAVFAFTVFSGCNKDDDDMGNEIKNEFTYDGTTYSLGKALYQDLGANGNGTFDLDIYLVSSGISPGGTFGLTGMGETLYLDLNTNAATGLVAGTYNWANARDNFTVVPGSSLRVGFDWNNGGGTTINLSNGSVDIIIDGMEATIMFSLTTTDGKTVSGEWKGVPEKI